MPPLRIAQPSVDASATRQSVPRFSPEEEAFFAEGEQLANATPDADTDHETS